MRETSVSRWVAYGAALPAIAGAVFVRWQLEPVLGPRDLYSTFFPAVMIAAYFGGLRPGLLVTVVGTIAANVVVDPRLSMNVKGFGDTLAMLLFVGTSVIICGLCESLHRAHRRSIADERQRATETQRETPQELRETKDRDFKRVEEALRESEHRFQMFADHATDAFFLQDEDSVILDVNRQACESLGYSREELVGMTPVEFDIDVSPDAMEATKRRLENGDVVEFDSRHRRKDGNEFPVEVRAKAFWEGGRRFVVALARDVTERRRAEQAIRESEERFRSTFENAGVGIALCDAEGNFVHVNQKFSDIVGFTDAELHGRSYRDITHPHDQLIDLKQIGQILRGDVPSYSVEKRYVRRDGSTVPVVLSASVLQRDLTGASVSLIAIIQDISDRKRLEKDLSDSNERLELAVRGSNLTIWELDMPDGVVDHGRSIHINGWEPLGYDPREAPTDFAEMYALLVDPEEHSRVSRAINDCLSGRTKVYEVEYRARHRSGEYRWHLARGVALRGPDGPRVRFIGSTVDVTDLKRAEAALRESEERFRGTFENAAVGIGNIDLGGRWLRVNQRLCDITGYAREELLGKTFQDITHPDDLRGSVEPFTQLWAGAVSSYSLEKRYVRKDGSHVWIETTVSLKRDAAGTPTNTIAIIQDISERKRLETEIRQAKEAAEAANRAKDEFLANVSHEIRTPMNAILGMTELVLDTPLDDDQHQDLKTVRSAANNLLGIINDLLDFSKVEAGKLELDLSEFSVRAVVGDTLRALAVRADRKGLELTCNIDPDVPDELVGDAGRVRQILLNVVGNAIKFTDRGEVVLRVERERLPAEGDTVALRFIVRDTGIGVPPDKQSTIFRAFEQADMSTTREYGGTGLGLTISTQLAALMGGTISVQSKPGHGSTFIVIVRFGRPREMPGGNVTRARTELLGLRVLVVDHDAANREIMQSWLRRWGMDVTGVADGTAAMDSMWQGVAAKRPYALVLLDARISDGDGFGLVARIREREELSGSQILLLKSSDSPGDHERAHDVRINGELFKPVQEAELLEMIYTVLSHSTVEKTSLGRPTPLIPAPSGMAPAVAPLLVLVAEDNEFNARLMEKLLIKRGYAVRLASDGREALKLLDASRFDILLLDVHMPHMDGFEVIQAIRERERVTGERLPVIALTARSRKQDEELCLAAGMDGYLAKPIRTEDLWAAISRAAPMLRRHDPPLTLLAPHVLLAACGADNQILRGICEGFLANAPDQLTALWDALLEQDTRRLREAAHKLSGMVSAFSTVAAALVSELEDLAEQGQLADTGTLIDRIDSSVHEIMTVLAGGVTVEQLHHDADPPFPSA